MIRMTTEAYERHQARVNGVDTRECPEQKPSKYRNVKTEVDGQTFDSAKEARRFDELRILLQAGQISDLKCQVKFDLLPSQKTSVGTLRGVSYIADFTYKQNDELVVEDVKSNFTRKLPMYVVKKKLMMHMHHIEIKEV